MDPSRAAAFVLPRILARDIDAGMREAVVQAVAAALTHAVDEVVAYAAEGVGRFLWSADVDLARTCVGALAVQARRLDELYACEEARPFRERRKSRELEHIVRPETRHAIVPGRPFQPEDLGAVDLGGWYGQQAIRHFLAILAYCPDEPIALEVYTQVASTIVAWWDKDRASRYQERERRPPELAFECLDRVARFASRLPSAQALQVCQPLLNAVERHPREVADFVNDLIAAEDQSLSRGSFWELWQALADRSVREPWITGLGGEHAVGSELVSRLFLGGHWQDEVQHWPPLEGHAEHIDGLLERLPAVGRVMDDYVRFLYTIGSHSLPRAFIVLARRLRGGDSREMLSVSNAIFCLESILARFVYGAPLHLKSDAELREAVLHLLNELVEVASSAAYRMRDDFVTPLRPVDRR